LSRRRALRRSPGRRDLLRAYAASLRSRRRRPRIFRLRSPRGRRRRPRRPAAPRPQDTPSGPPRKAAGRNRIQRPRNLRRRGVPPRRLPTWPRRRRLQARRSPLSPRRPQRLDQIQVPQSRRIRRRRLVGPGRVAALPGLLAARLSRRRWPVALRRPCRNRHVAEDARPPPPPPRATRRPENAARRSAAARNPLRRPARPLEGALGPPGAGRRDHLSDLGRGRLASPHRLRRPARRQACPRSPTRAPGLTPANGSGRYAVLTTCTVELSNGRLFLVGTRGRFLVASPRPIRRLALAGDPEGGTSRPRRRCCHAA